VHLAFQLMVGIGFTLLGLGLWYAIAMRRRRGNLPGKWLTRALLVATPLGFLAIEAGWTVTEVGRQPWVIYHVMRTEDAVTQVPNQFVALGGFTVLYLLLMFTLIWLLLKLAKTPPKIGPGRSDHAVE
ncbi:MAG TPA: cytochrome ubiquinol oxidase subunit I, partial [Thermomicrobiales bacterium]|nr:cytochrome ubiquinol oxidase subunit I [Thermomicrobiales bacterium]